MQQHINTYGGLNQDAAYDSIPNQQYIDAKDIRITTSDGESNGAFTNIEGNSQSFTIDQAGATGTKEIIGVCTIRNIVVLFCADDSNTNGWIYYITYDEKTRNITTSTGNPVLAYFNAGLNFSKNNPIEAEGRYENDDTQRIYWTDYNNFLRSLNIAQPINDPLSPLTTPLGSVDIFPSVDYTQPLIINTTSGGTLLTGMYQFAYRLITEDGKQTLISPPSNIFHLVSDSEATQLSDNYMGDPLSTNTNKSIVLTVDVSSYLTNFQKIELVALFYETLTGTAEISSVETINLDASGTQTFTYTGAENTISTLTSEEFGIKQYPFKTVKTLVPKDNSLVVANIKSSSFSVLDLLEPGETLDLHTYRYNSSSAKPTGSTENTEFNLQYNLDRHWEGLWHENEQYKYQANGTTLGGQSDGATPNLKYKFTINRQRIDGLNSPNYSSLINGATETITLNDGYSHPNNSFTSHASPYKSGLVRGYKRGETYRFGVIFYNKKGEASFVEYIGDIKFPDISDVDDSTTVVANQEGGAVNLDYFPIAVDGNRLGSASPHYTYGCDLGIEITLDFTTCPTLLNKIESYQIVRVPRTNNDKRRISTGILKSYSVFPIGEQNNSDGYEFRVSNQDNVLHLNHYTQSVINGAWNSLNNEYNLEFTASGGAEGFEIREVYLQYHSPEISYNFNRDNFSGNIGVLITGAYDQFSRTDVSGGPYWGVTSYSEAPNPGFEDIGGTVFQDLGDELSDMYGKCRETTPIAKTALGVYDGISNPVSYRGIEYFKFIDEKEFTSQAPLNPVVNASGGTGENTALRTYGPLVDVQNSPSLNFLRNVVVDVDDPGATLGGSRLNWPAGGTGAPAERPLLSRNASGLIITTTNFQNDPYTGVGTSLASSRPGFDVTASPSTVTPAIGYVQPAVPITNTPVPAVDYLWQAPVADIIAYKREIYGGYSQSALEANIFLPCSPVIDKSNIANVEIFGGDTFVTMFNFREVSPLINPYPFTGADASMQFRRQRSITRNLPIETQVNVDLAYGTTSKTKGENYYVDGGKDFVRQYLLQEEDNLSNAGGSGTNAKVLNAYKDAYNNVYSAEGDASGLGFFVKPDTIPAGLTEVVNDIRGYLSDVKINGEALDSWTLFRANNFYDVEADHGPINKIVNWRDDVYFMQDTGVGAYSINPRAITTTSDGIPTELGSGEGFAHHQYISTEHGSIHQWAVQTTDTGIYYFDATHKKIFRVGEGNNPLSEVKGMHSWLSRMNGDVLLRKENNGDNPILGRGINTVRDMINDEVLFSFHGRFTLRLVDDRVFTYYPGEYVYYVAGPDTFYFQVNTQFTTTTNLLANIVLVTNNCSPVTDEEAIQELQSNEATLVFDELAQQFSSFYSAVPPIYAENGNVLFSPDPRNRENIYVHNKGNFGEFYGTVSEAYLKLVINPNADINKILRFLEFASIVRDKDKTIDREKTITAFRVQTEYQDSGKTTFSANKIKRRFDRWRLKIPRDQLTSTRRGRLRSTHFILTLYYDNTYNKELILNRLMSHYDIQVY